MHEDDLIYDWKTPVLSLDGYQAIACGTAIYPGQLTPVGLAYVALKMNGEAGEFAEHVGKAMRDDDLLALGLIPERRELLIKEIGDVLWYLSAACNELGTTLSTAANINLRKLADRKARGTLQGSGDNR
jgi:NTP pyrophosphatase (non-canonical NTP hydrolase)